MQKQAKQLWQAALSDLKLRLSRTAYDNWLRQTVLVSFADGVATIGAPNSFAVSTLQNRYQREIERTLSSVMSEPVRVNFTVIPTVKIDQAGSPVPDQMSASTEETAVLLTGKRKPPRDSNRSKVISSRPASAAEQRSQMNLQPESGLIGRYVFDTYVVGSSNRFAHAAALAVADGPGGQYNPLFVYGGVGLGKTHLLHAIGARALEIHPNLTVMYVSSEKFTNDLINSLRGQRMDDFRARYRTIDLMMIDDIQFIAGKDSTQEEFFHTFNAIYQNGKQVVMSSDRPPKLIAGLADRLRSRFEGGLIADVQPPDFEMRIAILRARGDELGITLADDVLEYIANKGQGNIRELEGAMTKIVAYSRLTGQQITLTMAMEALAGSGPGSRRVELTNDEIIASVAQAFQVSDEEIRGRGRSKEVVLPRQVAMYMLRTETGASLAEIGLAFDRDHTTVLHSVEKIEELARTDTTMRTRLMAIKETLLHQ